MIEAQLRRWLDDLASRADQELAQQDAAREKALVHSRELIRLCAAAIREGHRGHRSQAEQLLSQAEKIEAEIQESLAPYPELYFAGYTQDALKELFEAQVTLALIGQAMLPPLDAVHMPLSTCLNGVCEAASELRRACLDLLRREEFAEAERLLAAMDAVYDVLMSFGYPDGITKGLRRRVDQLRGVLERTRGDLTNALQMAKLRRALEEAQGEEGAGKA